MTANIAEKTVSQKSLYIKTPEVHRSRITEINIQETQQINTQLYKDKIQHSSSDDKIIYDSSIVLP